MNDYTDTWAGHTIYTCLNVYLGPKWCLWKHPTFICQSFKFRLKIKHPPLTAKRISFLLFSLTFYWYAKISSKFLRYVRGRISQIWQRAARWNWHRSRPFVLFSRTHLGILKRFRGIHTQGPWQRSTSASFPSFFKQKDVLDIESWGETVMNWWLFLGASFGYKKIPSAFYRRLIIPGIRHQAAFTLPITQGLAGGEPDSDTLTQSKLKKSFSLAMIFSKWL